MGLAYMRMAWRAQSFVHSHARTCLRMAPLVPEWEVTLESPCCEGLEDGLLLKSLQCACTCPV